MRRPAKGRCAPKLVPKLEFRREGETATIDLSHLLLKLTPPFA
jgi:hypothetical protein